MVDEAVDEVVPVSSAPVEHRQLVRLTSAAGVVDDAGSVRLAHLGAASGLTVGPTALMIVAMDVHRLHPLDPEPSAAGTTITGSSTAGYPTTDS